MKANAIYRFAPCLLLLASAAAFGQQLCSTPAGQCGLQGALPPGSSCYCFYPNGAVQGVVGRGGQSSLAPRASAPPPPANFCCTPAGRFGPGQVKPPGSFCSVVMRGGGIVNGQACY
jgi:hypothetical protein